MESFRDDSALPSSITTRRTSPDRSLRFTPVGTLPTIPKGHGIRDESNQSSSEPGDGIAALKAALRRTLGEDDRVFRDHSSGVRNEDAIVESPQARQWPQRTSSLHSSDSEEVEDPTGTTLDMTRQSRLSAYSITAEREREFVMPSALPPPGPAAQRPDRNSFDEPDLEEEVESQPTVVWQSATTEPDAAAEPSSDHTEKLGFWGGTKATFKAAYLPAKCDAPLILPSGPTDEEKLGYLHTNRVVLYCAGIFSFLSLATGMWLFVASSYYFAWFAIFCIAMQLYMGVGYVVGLVGKDFDYENHKRIVREHPIDPDTCPTVDIYLPVCKEPIEILNNTWKYVERLKYPRHKFNVYVLDDGAQDAVRDLAAKFKFEYIVRGDRPRLKKAGNLRWAFQRTTGDFFNIYDADFCPREDFLLELMPMMLEDPKIAIVQSPQFFRTKSEQTWVEQGAGAVQELFYRVVQVNRDRWGASICVGSNALYRRAALVDVGGTAEIGFSEDVHTGFGCVDRGWKVRYNPLCLACGVCPDQPRAFFSQQMRWCMGSTTLLSNPEFWKSNLTVGQKICYLCGMMYYSAVSLSIFVNPMPGIFMVWLRPEYFKFYNLAFAIPSILYTIICFRFWAKAEFGFNVQFCMVIQSYAYFTAIKDKIFGKALQWAPSGDNKAHKNNKYRNMRIMAWCWLMTWAGALIGGMVYQVFLLTAIPFYDCIPLLCLDLFNIFCAHRFLLCDA